MLVNDNIFDVEKYLIVVSGWVTAGAAGIGAVSIKRSQDMWRDYDVVLITRLSNPMGSSKYAWAKFIRLRGYWNSARGLPIEINVPTNIDPLLNLKHKLYETRSRYNWKKAGSPSISLLCPLHRSEDIDNLLKQLS